MARLIFDEQLESRRLLDALAHRGLEASSVGDYGATGQPDPDVVRKIADKADEPWVLVTLDLAIVEHFKGFEWDRYAIAWVAPGPQLRGDEFETEKVNIVHKYALEMAEQTPGDHHTYTLKRHFKTGPSLTSLLKPKYRM